MAKSKSGKFRVGIIGSGGIARMSHVPGFQACPEAEIVAMCDINIERAKSAAEAAGIPRW
ncbi:MAG TPA: Gfo/Idh/MocA family oxidoreductase, partial [bacterium]|nr:Gfo/Idh/MocA family oxidoreductase [bacterium]